MTKNDDLLQHIMEIKERTAKIEQHLSDINGKIIRHDKFLSVDCPKRKDDCKTALANLDKMITITSLKVGIVVGIIVGALTMFGPRLMNAIFS